MMNRMDFTEIESHFQIDANFSLPDPKAWMEYCEAHVLFISLTVNCTQAGRPEGIAKQQLAGFGRFYFHTCKEVLGDPEKQRYPDKPLAYAFVDYSGTRLGLGHGDGAHVHALMLLPGHQKDRFKSFMYNADFKPKMITKLNLSNLDIQDFDQSEGSLEELITYCTKGLSMASSGGTNYDEHWQIYPPEPLT